jgi:hypothetical protein
MDELNEGLVSRSSKVSAAIVKAATNRVDPDVERKIILATEGFMTKFCESTLRDRSKLSQDNAVVIADYIIAMKREVNPRLNYINMQSSLYQNYPRLLV